MFIKMSTLHSWDTGFDIIYTLKGVLGTGHEYPWGIFASAELLHNGGMDTKSIMTERTQSQGQIFSLGNIRDRGKNCSMMSPRVHATKIISYFTWPLPATLLTVQ